MSMKHLIRAVVSPRNKHSTYQGAPTPGREDEVQNSDGAFVYEAGLWTRLHRFLILGSEGGSYYASESVLRKDNAATAFEALKVDGVRFVAALVDVSVSGKAPKNDTALFCLALASAYGDDATRSLAFSVLPKVARTGTHLFTYVEFVSTMRGWGKGLKKAISNWYIRLADDPALLGGEAMDEAKRRVSSPVEQTAFQVVKYAQRNGWSHKDLLKLAHPFSRNQANGLGGVSPLPIGAKGEGVVTSQEGDGRAVKSKAQDILFDYIAHGWPGVGIEPHPISELQVLWASERVKARDIPESEVIRLISEYHLPMEVIPTERRTASVYEAILHSKPGVTWLIRNLGTLSKLGVVATGVYSGLDLVTKPLTDPIALKKARVHPISILSALKTYGSGHAMRGNSAWPVVPQVTDALEAALYLAFDQIEPTEKRFVLGVDVSASMDGNIIGSLGLTSREAAAVMAMVTRRSEKKAVTMAFSTTFLDLYLSPGDSLKNVIRKMSVLPFASTDCAAPMTWALKNKVEADVFVVYTDNETNSYQSLKPSETLRKYRDEMGIDAKLIVAAFVANRFSIADPLDAGMLDIAGFDSSAPSIIREFALGSF